MQIVLIGMMYSGKTTVGRALAQSLYKSWFDSDIEIEGIYGKIADIFQKQGERFFRTLEENCIENILSGQKDCILSTGGGSILSAKVCTLIKNCHVIYLKTSLCELQKRIQIQQEKNFSNRPLAQNLEKIYYDRYALYQQMANSIIETDAKSVATIVQEIQSILKN